MYSLPIFRNILNLNWKKVLIMWIYEETKKVIFQIRWKYWNQTCPCCGLNTNKRHDKKSYKQKYRLKHMLYWWNKIIELELHKRYFRCTKCNTRFFEKFDFESPFWMYTTDFEKYIQWNWWHVSWNKLSELYQTSGSVIYSILERIDVELINKRWLEIIEELAEIYLWVDEHSFSGHDMVLIITELKTWQLLAVLDWITKEKLEKWIWNIPLKNHNKILWFSTDMNKGYANSLEQIIWNPIHSVDKMHLFIEANRVVDWVRDISRFTLSQNFIKLEDIHKLGKKIWKKITKEDIEQLNKNQTDKNKIEWMKKYKEKAEQRLKIEEINPKDLLNSKWEKVEYKEITADYFIEKWYRLLFMYREKKLELTTKTKT